MELLVRPLSATCKTSVEGLKARTGNENECVLELQPFHLPELRKSDYSVGHPSKNRLLGWLQFQIVVYYDQKARPVQPPGRAKDPIHLVRKVGEFKPFMDFTVSVRVRER